MTSPHEKAKSIRLFILDIDGVLTTGALYYLSDGVDMRGFHAHDGLGIQLLQKSGVDVAIISAKKSDVLERRLNDLHIQHVYLGYENKLPAYEAIKQTLQLDDHEIGYMGDDLPDLPLLRRAGFAATVPNAPSIIAQHVDYITKSKPGKGAVREVCELIMKAQDRYESVIQSYLTS